VYSSISTAPHRIKVDGNHPFPAQKEPNIITTTTAIYPRSKNDGRR
jgi:hypothetical protein